MEEPQVYVEAEEQFSSGVNGLTFQQIVLNQISKINIKMTAEWSPSGYWSNRIVNGRDVEIWVCDPRQEFIAGIKCLFDMLSPRFDKTFDKNIIAVETKIADIKAKMKNIDIPNPELLKRISKEQQFNMQNKVYQEAERLKNEEAETYREMYRVLHSLLKRLDYLGIKQFEGKA